MSTFAKASFDSVGYAASRPTYPPQLYNYVLKYLKDSASYSPTPPMTLLDLGSGPGLSTFEFIPHFDRVIGLDPSAGMVKAAQGILNDRHLVKEGKEVIFEVGKGEDLKNVPTGSVDLVVAGQAAHWFAFPKVYPELRRVLKPGGAFVFWGYGECFFPLYENLTKLIPKYSGVKLGAYWQQPGRSIVESLLSPVSFPTNDPTDQESTSTINKHGLWSTTSYQRTYFARRTQIHSVSDLHLPKNPTDDILNVKTSLEPLLFTHKWDLKQIEGYLRTWSSAHTYDEKMGEGSDVVTEFLEELKKGMQKEMIGKKEKIEVAWRGGLLCGRKE